MKRSSSNSVAVAVAASTSTSASGLTIELAMTTIGMVVLGIIGGVTFAAVSAVAVGDGSGMIEWDLGTFPNYTVDNETVGRPFKWKVQCPAGGRCYIKTKSTYSWGFDPDINFRSGSWSISSGPYGWFFFVNGPVPVLEDMFRNDDPYIRGDYCIDPEALTDDAALSDFSTDGGLGGDIVSNFNDTLGDDDTECSIVCTDDCLCALEWLPVEECVIVEEYPDLELPPPEDRTVIEFLEPTNVPSTRTLQLRCQDFLNGCYLDTTNFDSSSSTAPTDYDGFFAIDYFACQGDRNGSVPCLFACDPGCECTVFLPGSNTTESCTVLPPTESPTGAPSESPTETPSGAGGAPNAMLILMIQLIALLAVTVVGITTP